MNALEIKPLTGIGRLKLGMSRYEVIELLGAPSASQAAHRKWDIDFPDKDFFFQNTMQIEYDTTGQVNFICLSQGSPFEVTYKGVNVLKSPADFVVAHLEKFAALDRHHPERGCTYLFPSYELTCWREADPAELRLELESKQSELSEDEILDQEEDIGRYQYFEGVAIGVKGYYSET